MREVIAGGRVLGPLLRLVGEHRAVDGAVVPLSPQKSFVERSMSSVVIRVLAVECSASHFTCASSSVVLSTIAPTGNVRPMTVTMVGSQRVRNSRTREAEGTTDTTLL